MFLVTRTFPTVAAFEAVTCNYSECGQFRPPGVSSGRHNSLIQPNMNA